MRKTVRKLALALALGAVLSGCAQKSAKVPVVQVSMLASASLSSEKFAGVVVSENAVQIPRDLDKSIKTVHVAVGDEVRSGSKLFSYDSDELSLTLDRQDLDLERLKASIKEKEKQISDVNKELKGATGDKKTALNIELRQLQADLTQAKYDQEVKKTEIEYTEKMLKNADVFSPIDGTVRKIEDSSAEAYMVIQQSGAYRVQGTLNEMSMNAGIREGTEVTILSRLDPEQTWQGIVSHVDYNNTMGGDQNNGGMIGGMGGMMGGGSPAGSTSYPFYVTLTDTTGLLLGQHVYIQIGALQPMDDRVLVPSGYLLDITTDPETFEATASVLAPDESGKLAKRTVKLGLYDEALDCYEIWEGLTAEDFVADPSGPDAVEGAQTDLRSEQDYQPEPETTGIPGETAESGFSGDPAINQDPDSGDMGNDETPGDPDQQIPEGFDNGSGYPGLDENELPLDLDDGED